MLAFCENLSRKQNFLLKYDWNNGCFTSRPVCTFMIITRSILVGINVSDQSCNENQNTHLMFLRKSYRLPDKVEKYGTARQTTDDNIIRRMRFVCGIRKATDKHSEYVIIPAFPRQQWLHERPSIFHLYIHCLSCLGLIQAASDKSKTAVITIKVTGQ